MSDSPYMSKPGQTRERYDTHIDNPWVQMNRFFSMQPVQTPLPTYPQVREILPDPFWSGHSSAINCYWRAWELAFSNLKSPTAENDFVSNYCDTAFNGNLFMWDSSFVTCFGGYGRRAFDFQKTLDNFYRKQHRDGFICREISEKDGTDTFHRFDPSSTGPNILAWAEWNDYLKTGDTDRLEWVFPPLVAYHQWLRTYRTWKDGSYWSTGWGCGMDNLPRLRGQEHAEWTHGHMTWVDATLQAILSAKILSEIAEILGKGEVLADLRAEIDKLTTYVNYNLWNEDIDFYCDRFDDGNLSRVKHIGAFWALLAACVPDDRLSVLIDHLENPAEFNRLHRIPALSADDPHFGGDGNYWCGGVWAPTNYMTLKGLVTAGRKDLAHQIALNHNQNVVRVFELENTPWKGAEQFRQYFHLSDLIVEDQHTLWENYAPDEIAPGGHSKPGYVGWTGIPPIAVLFEDIFGIVPNAPVNCLTWEVRLLEEHGINRYPFGRTGMIDLFCSERTSSLERPAITIQSNVPFRLEMIWDGGGETILVDPESK